MANGEEVAGVVLVVVCVLALLGTVAVWVLRRVRRGGSPTLKSLDSGVREPLAGARRRHSSIESIEIVIDDTRGAGAVFDDVFDDVPLGPLSPPSMGTIAVRRRSKDVFAPAPAGCGDRVVSIALEPSQSGVLGVVLKLAAARNGDTVVLVERVMPGFAAWMSEGVGPGDEVISISGKPLAACATLDDVKRVFGTANADACALGCNVVLVLRRAHDSDA